MHIVLMCRSLTSAQKAARIIQNHGIFAVVTKAPQSANPGGCTYGVKIAERNRGAALEILALSGDGSFTLVEDNGKTDFVSIFMVYIP